MTFSSTLFALKLGMAVAGALAGWLLSYYGYEPGETQTANALYGIALLFTVIPAVGSLVSAFIVRLYSLDGPKLASVQADLHERLALVPTTN